MSDWQIPETGKQSLGSVAIGKIADKGLKEREKLGWAKLLVSMDRNNIAREAVRSRVDALQEVDERFIAATDVKTAEELRRDPEYIRWACERATAADAGSPGSLGVARIVGLGSAPHGDQSGDRRSD